MDCEGYSVLHPDGSNGSNGSASGQGWATQRTPQNRVLLQGGSTGSITFLKRIGMVGIHIGFIGIGGTNGSTPKPNQQRYPIHGDDSLAQPMDQGWTTIAFFVL